MKNNNDAAALRQIFSKNLAFLMSSQNETISDISTALSIPFSTVADWVHGRKYPRMDKVQLLAEHFGVMKSDLTEEKPATVPGDELSLDDKLVKLLLDLSPEEAQMVRIFVQGMIANRKEPSSQSE